MALSRRRAMGAALMHATQSMSTDIYIVALPLIGLYFNAPLLEVQATMLSFVLGLAVAHLFVGNLADYYGRRPVIFIGLGFYLLATLYATFAPTLPQLTLARFIQGLATACGPIVMRAIVRDSVTPSQTAQAFALTGLIAAFGPVLAPTLGSLAVEFGGWRMSLGALLLYASIVLLYNALTLSETLKPEHKAKTPLGSPFVALKQLLPSRDFRHGAALIFLGYGGLYAWLSTSSYILMDKLHYGQRETGVFIGLSAVCFMFGTLVTNRLVKTIKTYHLLCFAGFIGALSAMSSLVLLKFNPSIYLLFFVMSFFYIGWGIIQPLAMGQAMRPFAAIAGQASAWFGIAQFLGAMSIALIAGLFGGGQATFMVMFMAMFFVLWLGIRQGRQN